MLIILQSGFLLNLNLQQNSSCITKLKLSYDNVILIYFSTFYRKLSLALVSTHEQNMFIILKPNGKGISRLLIMMLKGGAGGSNLESF